MNELRCLYDDPGVKSENPTGLMGAAGASPTGYRDRLITEMAQTIAEALSQGRAMTDNIALRKVLEFRDGGPGFIASRPEPIALTCVGDKVFVREGTHRAIALALLGEAFVEAIDFERAELT